MAKMYCSKCKMNVFTVREDLDIGLIIILCIFTAGIGAIIYLAIYFDNDSNRCIHCKSICQPIMIVDNNDDPMSPLKCGSNEMSKKETISQIEIKDKRTKYCFNCGIALDERERLNYCAYCGIKLN